MIDHEGDKWQPLKTYRNSLLQLDVGDQGRATTRGGKVGRGHRLKPAGAKRKLPMAPPSTEDEESSDSQWQAKEHMIAQRQQQLQQHQQQLQQQHQHHLQQQQQQHHQLQQQELQHRAQQVEHHQGAQQILEAMAGGSVSKRRRIEEEVSSERGDESSQGSEKDFDLNSSGRVKSQSSQLSWLSSQKNRRFKENVDYSMRSIRLSRGRAGGHQEEEEEDEEEEIEEESSEEDEEQ
uniref:Myb-like protein I-like n=1 Tax=Saccoglossus kowalevskii TaxID=10224 RepID=A0ABM0M1M3_SACKO